MSTEKSLQQWAKKCLLQYRILTYKFESPGRAGVPDLVCIGPNGVFFIELKSPKGTGRLSPVQELTIAEMRNHGAAIYVCASKEEILATIEWEQYTLSMKHRSLVDYENT